MIKPEDELGAFRVSESTLEDGSVVYDVYYLTRYGEELVAQPPSQASAEALADALNLVRTRILDCGSDQEVFRLSTALQQWAEDL